MLYFFLIQPLNLMSFLHFITFLNVEHNLEKNLVDHIDLERNLVDHIDLEGNLVDHTNLDKMVDLRDVH